MFKTGDIITGINGAPYLCTTRDAVMKVVDGPRNGRMLVEIVRHKDPHVPVGVRFLVELKYFVKADKFKGN